MHRAFQIPELIEHTFSHLIACPDSDIYRHEHDDRGTLAAAARTCKLWKEPALLRLWSEQESLFPLLGILGQLKGEEIVIDEDPEEGDTTATEYRFKRPISGDRWPRFRTYAAYIRTFRLTLDCEAAFKPSVYKALVENHPEEDILPNMRRFHFSDASERNAGLNPFLTFLSPSIRELGLDLSDESASIGFQHIQARFPHPESLSTCEEDSLVTRIQDLKHLRSLDISPKEVDESFMDFLAKFLFLEGLRLGEWNGKFFQVPALPRAEFLNLHSLSMMATIDAWMEFLKGSDLQSCLLNITVDLGRDEVPPRPGRLIRLCDALASAIPHLRHFHLKTQWKWSLKYPVSLNHIRPLLTCRHLHTFILKNSAGADLSHDDLKVMLDSWPSLRCFRFNCFDWQVAKLPLEVLETFAERCPDLEELALPMSDESPRHRRTPTKVTLRRLRILDFHKSPIPYPEMTAMYLAEMASDSVSLRWQDKLVEDVYTRYMKEWFVHVERWIEVGRLAKGFRLRNSLRRKGQPGWWLLGLEQSTAKE